MKKAGIAALFALFLILMFPLNAAAEEQSSDELIENSGIYEAAEQLEKENRDFLATAGLEEVSAQALYNLDFRAILQAVGRQISLSFREQLRAFLAMIAAVFVCALADSFAKGARRVDTSKMVAAACCLFLSGVCMVPLSQTLSVLGAAVESAAGFTATGVPILCTILAAQGKTLSAAAFNGAAVVMGQVMTTLFSAFFMPLVQVLLAVGFISSVSGESGLEPLVTQVRKYLLIALSASAGLYFSVLGLKAKAGAVADESALKAVKLAAGNFLPVIGSALSDSAGVVVSSLALSKTVIGGFGMAAIVAIFLPVIVQSVLWYLCLETAAFAAGFFSLNSALKVLKNLSAAVSVLAIIVIFCTLVFLLNFGLIIGSGG